MVTKAYSCWRVLCGCKSGVALIEFGLILPLLVLLLLGTLELSRYMIINQKLDKVAYMMSDLVTQGSSVRVSDLEAFADAVPYIASPFGFSGTVIFSSVVGLNLPTDNCEDIPSCITWQYSVLGGDPSHIGAVGGTAILPNGYEVLPGQNIIVAEVVFNFSPLFAYSGTLVPELAPHSIYKITVYKPRQGTLITLE